MADFPTTVSGLALWFDGRASRYVDLAGNTGASSGQQVARVDQPSPLSGFFSATQWRVIQDSRPMAEPNALGFNCGDYTRIKAPSVALTSNAVTYSVAFVARYSPESSEAQDILSVLDTAGRNNGLQLVFNQNAIIWTVNNSGTQSSLGCPLGAQIAITLRITSTTWALSVAVNGVRTDQSGSGSFSAFTINPSAVTGVDPQNIVLGTRDNVQGRGFHGAISQAIIYSRAISDVENDGLVAWLVANAPAQYAPTTFATVMTVGDSIARGLNIEGDRGNIWSWRRFPYLFYNFGPFTTLNTAGSGRQMSDLVANYAAEVVPWYSASRARNVLVVAAGTNNMANGSQSAATALAEYYSYCDTAKAAGWRIVVCTVLPRSGAANDATFEVNRLLFNADIRANYLARGYSSLADVASIALMGAPNAEKNTNYYQDLIHPTVAGQRVLEPIYRAAVLSALL